MAIWGEVELLCRAISEAGREAAERVLEEANGFAQKRVSEARARIEMDHREEMLSQRGTIHAEARRLTDSAELEARRRIMTFREQVIHEVFTALEHRVREFRGLPEYSVFLLAVIQEGIRSLPGDAFIVELNEADVRPFGERIQQVAEAGSLTIQGVPSHVIEGGVRVYTADRRLLYDNTFSARLRRNEEAIRQEIGRELFGAAGRQR